MKSSAASPEGFTKICSLGQLNEGEGKRFIVDDVDIALFRIGDRVYAVSNHCPHQHTAMIYDGFVEQNYVVCPVHGWMFSLETGRLPSGSKGLDTYEVEVIADDVYVKITQKNWDW